MGRRAEPQAVTRADGADPKPNQMPRLDLVLVGMGLDGHCGSIYPNSDAPHLTLTPTPNPNPNPSPNPNP